MLLVLVRVRSGGGLLLEVSSVRVRVHVCAQFGNVFNSSRESFMDQFIAA